MTMLRVKKTRYFVTSETAIWDASVRMMVLTADNRQDLLHFVLINYQGGARIS